MGAYPEEGLRGAEPARLNWLSGSWKGSVGGDPVEEMWSSEAGDALMGMFRWIKERNVRFYEFIAIERADGQVWMRIKHFHPGLRGWEEKDRSTEFLLVQLGDREAVFLQVGKPGTWLVYRIEPDGALTAFFRKEGEPVDPEDVFRFIRQAA